MNDVTQANTSNEQRQTLTNRLKKNTRHLGKWLRKNDITCYRLYDADIPEFAFAIDVYAGVVTDKNDSSKSQIWAHVQEYAAPKSIPAEIARKRLLLGLDVVCEHLGITHNHLILKIRKQQKGTAQYEKVDSEQQIIQVNEGGLLFKLNLSDYLDTGLFLDHRITRDMIRTQANGKRFLNLFAYTGSVTVYAASGGAKSTATVDMSKTYLEWAKENMLLNGFNLPEHRYIQTDCLQWLKSKPKEQYDLIFLDPPSFSTSKRMQATFDVQRDQQTLIDGAMAMLAPDGLLVFSNNLRSFKLAPELQQTYTIKNISRLTLPKDYERNPKIHNCWEIRHR